MSAGRTLPGLCNAPTLLCMSALLILGVTLGACSRGPSAGDIQATLQTTANGLFGKMASKIENVSDVDCKEAQGKPGYVCSFKVTTFSNLMNTRDSEVLEARFVQNDSTWIMMSDK
jgi:hypothetical protein